MRRTIIVLTGLFIVQLLVVSEGCGLLKSPGKTTTENNSTATQKTEMSVSEQKYRTKNSSGISLHQDSARSNYSVTIWPKGSFNFSADSTITVKTVKTGFTTWWKWALIGVIVTILVGLWLLKKYKSFII